MTRHAFPFWRFEGVLHRLLSLRFRRRFASYGASAFVSPFAAVDGMEHVSVGNGAFVGRRTLLLVVPQPSGQASRLNIGMGSYVGRGCTLSACGSLSIGEDVTIGDNAYISAGQHGHATPGTHILKQPMQTAEVEIGTGAWIGYGAFVSAIGSLTIGEGAIVGANAVVTKSVPAYTMVGGVPARPLRRFDRDRGEWIPVTPPAK